MLCTFRLKIDQCYVLLAQKLPMLRNFRINVTNVTYFWLNFDQCYVLLGSKVTNVTYFLAQKLPMLRTLWIKRYQRYVTFDKTRLIGFC